MPKIYVEFESIEQAQIALNAVNGGAQTAPAYAPPAAPAYVPPAAPAPLPQAAVAPAPLPVAAPAAIPAAQVAPAPAPVASGYTQAQCATALQAYCQKHSPKAGKALLGQFGIDAITKLDPTMYAQFIQAASA